MNDQISTSSLSSESKDRWLHIWRICNALLAFFLLFRLILYGKFEVLDHVIIIYGCVIGIIQSLYKRGEFGKILYFFKRDNK